MEWLVLYVLFTLQETNVSRDMKIYFVFLFEYR